MRKEGELGRKEGEKKKHEYEYEYELSSHFFAQFAPSLARETYSTPLMRNLCSIQHAEDENRNEKQTCPARLPRCSSSMNSLVECARAEEERCHGQRRVKSKTRHYFRILCHGHRRDLDGFQEMCKLGSACSNLTSALSLLLYHSRKTSS